MQYQFVHIIPKAFEANERNLLLLIVNLRNCIPDFHHVQRCLLQAVQLAGDKLPAARIFEHPKHPQLSSRLARSNACKQGGLVVGTNRLEASCTGPERLGLDRKKGTISRALFFSFQNYRESQEK